MAAGWVNGMIAVGKFAGWEYWHADCGWERVPPGGSGLAVGITLGFAVRSQAATESQLLSAQAALRRNRGALASRARRRSKTVQSQDKNCWLRGTVGLLVLQCRPSLTVQGSACAASPIVAGTGCCSC